jgi:hypothetical protein
MGLVIVMGEDKKASITSPLAESRQGIASST